MTEGAIVHGAAAASKDAVRLAQVCGGTWCRVDGHNRIALTEKELVHLVERARAAPNGASSESELREAVELVCWWAESEGACDPKRLKDAAARVRSAFGVPPSGDAVVMFRRWMTGDTTLRSAGKPPDIGLLRGMDLACWCKPGEPCHADVLLELANAPHCEGGPNA